MYLLDLAAVVMGCFCCICALYIWSARRSAFSKVETYARQSHIIRVLFFGVFLVAATCMGSILNIYYAIHFLNFPMTDSYQERSGQWPASMPGGIYHHWSLAFLAAAGAALLGVLAYNLITNGYRGLRSK